MQDYYNRRAKEYEEIYRRNEPLRQSELATLAADMQDTLLGLDVLEIACGTGYWTERLAGAARTVVANDASQEMLDIVRSKHLPSNVSFVVADAYDLGAVEGTFGGGLANFWFSHVPRARLAAFLSGLHRKLGTRAQVFMVDNCYMPGVGGQLVRPKGSSDTFKRRTLSDGTKHLILKNYYDADDLSSIFAPLSRNLRVHVGTCYWWISYEVA